MKPIVPMPGNGRPSRTHASGGQLSSAVGKGSTALPSETLETEWQFDARDLDLLEKWLSENVGSGPFASSPRGQLKIVDLYLDTSDLKILRAGYALRIRQKAGWAEASLKELTSRNGSLCLRREITQPLASGQMRALFVGTGPVTERLRLLCREDDLIPLAPVWTERKLYLITHVAESGVPTSPISGEVDDTGGPVSSDNLQLPTAEVALDSTRTADSLCHIQRLTRLEVEVVQGDAETFRTMAERMRNECNLEDARQSKFQWAIAANGIQVDKTMSLGAGEITRSMSVGQLADAVLRKNVASFLWHEPGTRLGDDPEHLHDMRVAARRIRAALKLFREIYSPEEADRIRNELGEFGRRLGEVRDLDVFTEDVRRLSAGLVAVAGTSCDPLLTHIACERVQARKQMKDALDSPAFAALKKDLVNLLHQGPRAGQPEVEVRVLRFAPQVIARARRRVISLGRELKLDTPAVRYHLLRIRAKRLRYAIEFYRDVYGNVAKEMIEALVDLQDLLGLHQDTQVAIGKLQAIAYGKPAEFTPECWTACGELSQVYHSRVETLRRDLPRLLRRLEGHRWQALKRAMLDGLTEKDEAHERGGDNGAAPNEAGGKREPQS